MGTEFARVSWFAGGENEFSVEGGEFEPMVGHSRTDGCETVGGRVVEAFRPHVLKVISTES